MCIDNRRSIGFRSFDCHQLCRERVRFSSITIYNRANVMQSFCDHWGRQRELRQSLRCSIEPEGIAVSPVVTNETLNVKASLI